MCMNCEYGEYIDKCDKILEDWDNDWCWDTVEGIKNWIEKKEHIIDKQKETIDHIIYKIENA
jgi:hypothetical protein